MPILTSDIISQIRTVGLDAQPDTQFYTDADDIIPAIDSAVKWITQVINQAKSNNKACGEALRELSKCRIYRTSSQSRIQIDNTIWSVDSVAPLCNTVSNGTPTPPAPPSTFGSWYRTDLVFTSSYYSCHRKTVEESNYNRNNPFSPGYMPPTVQQSQLIEGSSLNISFGYMEAYDYNNPTSVAGSYIEILPEIPLRLCGVFVVEVPAKVVASNQSILFPSSLFNILYEKSLQFISYSQGDGTNVWGVTDKDVSILLSAIGNQ